MPNLRTVSAVFHRFGWRGVALDAATGAAERRGGGEVMIWQPIDTAPKDGSVICTDDSSGLTNWCASKWLAGEEWSGWIYDDELLLDNNPCGPCPSFWIHIPPVPLVD
jgi:hypothetical protein